MLDQRLATDRLRLHTREIARRRPRIMSEEGAESISYASTRYRSSIYSAFVPFFELQLCDNQDLAQTAEPQGAQMAYDAITPAWLCAWM